jgi:TctA family transporter
MTWEDWKRSWPAWLRGTAFGFRSARCRPGGAEIPTFLSYSTERKLARHPEEFGNGAIEGVAGPEAANNASAAGTLVPLLTLGLPTSATAAMMLAGLPAIRPQSRAAAVRRKARSGVGADREPVHREPDAAGAQPAAGRACG